MTKPLNSEKPKSFYYRKKKEEVQVNRKYLPGNEIGVTTSHTPSFTRASRELHALSCCRKLDPANPLNCGVSLPVLYLPKCGHS